MPDWKNEITRRLQSLKLAPAREAEIVEEVAQHLEDRYQELVGGGVTEEAARRMALEELSDEKILARGLQRVEPDQRQEPVVPARPRGDNFLTGIWPDIRYGARQLRRNPGFTAVSVLILALGIGANTTIFSLADALLFRPFPIAEPGRVVALTRQKVEQPDSYSSFSYPDYEDFREQTKTLSGLAASSSIPVSMTMNGEATRIQGEIVSGNYFSVLGIQPALGRTFVPEEDQAAGAHAVIVASDDFWRHRLNADRGIIGKSLTLNGGRFTVIGVAPAGFRGLYAGSSPAFWVPLAMHDQMMPSFTFEGHSLFFVRTCDWLDLVGRLKPGRTVAEAEAEAKTQARREAAAYPEDKKGWTVVVSGLNEARNMWNPDMTKLMGLLMAVVGLVLLIACSNVAGLLLARASARRMEVGIRTGLGARRGRLIRQLLTESLLLSGLGGAGALLLARLTIRLLTTVQLPGIDMTALDLKADWRVLGFTFALAALTAVIFGVMPALETSKVDLVDALKGSSRTASSDRTRFRQALVASQIALSLLLLVGAGLLIRSLRNILGMNLGFDPRNVLLTSVDLGLGGYTEARSRQFYEQVLERVRQSPEVRSACWAATAPLSGLHIAFNVVLEGAKPGPDQSINVDGNWVSPGFFSTLGIPMVAGRDFASQDRVETPRVAIVSESTARLFWPGKNPLGQRFWMHARGKEPSLEVIGVVKDGKYYCSWCNWRANQRPFVFLPFNQTFQTSGTLLVKGVTGAGNLAASIREDVQALDPNLPVFDIKTLQEQFQEGFLLERVGAALVAAFGVLALALAAVGVFGLVSYSVGQRTHEIGVRIALGAKSHDVINLVLRQGLALTAIGVGAGLCGAVGLARLISSLLYGVKPTDPLTLALATLMLAGVAFLACYLPARRATKVDPMVALRYE